MQAERALNRRLHGGCQVPIAGFAELKDKLLRLRGRVIDPSGKRLIESEHSGPSQDAEKIGLMVAEALLHQGAGEILADCGITGLAD